ncbi:conserved hypothetical protein [Pediculus humanus corporis]|uniref:DUF4604 domain-containing protein n=1 Tax=Pediculus humanus subsp. corporis TaxID=121224 RepID=E0VZT8_PEDHC|nr:uncharacterized protein Phum_PHUM538060 [Pediculus humanus corporis]EEB18894.1 conserved hypothetical protein [Pediculus humanus corporis]
MYKKRNVAYVKPQEPSFLTKLKREAGYVPGPDINTKKEQLPVDSDSDSEKPDESPVVVVVKPGDLTPEEVAKINAKKKFELENTKADLTKKVIFQKPSNSKRKILDNKEEICEKSKKVKKVSKQLLSFDQGEENEC